MIKNHLKVALRHLRRNRSYALLNTGGLALGLAACLLIALWVRHETSYDAFHEKADRLYRVVVDMTRPDGSVAKINATPMVLGRALEAEGVPAVEQPVRFSFEGGLFRSPAGRQFYEGDAERDFLLADPAALTAFSFPLAHGDRRTALRDPGSIVLSQEAARRYFPGDENPLGRTLRRGDGQTFTVTGILAPVPEASQLRPALMASLSTYEEDSEGWRNWFSFSAINYVLLREGVAREEAQQQINRLADANEARMNEMGYAADYRLEPLTDVHLRGLGAEGRLRNVRLFSLVALFILALACVNYTNLATAQSRRRAKEVGVRRTVGAGRGEVAAQFLTESVLLAGAAGLVALGLARAALPAFEALADTSFSFAGGGDLLAFAGVAVLVGLAAGAYPALLLSGFRPADVLRGTSGTGGAARQSTALRRGLTVFQFAVAIGLIAATGVVFSQLRHMQRQSLGFQQERMLVLNFGGDDDVQERLESVKARLERLPAVERVAASSDYPSGGSYMSLVGTIEGPDGQEQRAEMEVYRVDTSFAATYQMALVAGQPMSRAALPDSMYAYVLNETAVRKQGFATPEAAIGRRIDLSSAPGRVVGVVKDFHDTGLQKDIPPLALVEIPGNTSTLTLRLAAGSSTKRALAHVEAAWAEIAPQRPFDYQFLDQAFDAQYRAERRFGRLFGVGAGLAIFVACLGLFGLAAFAVEERTKEIGIRKVLGASAGSIVGLLSKDFLLLVAVGFAIAAPVAWWAMSRWLEGFAYRIELGPLVFIASGAVALLVAALTVSTQALRAARSNPVDALRPE